jgi:hypothetical protein
MCAGKNDLPIDRCVIVLSFDGCSRDVGFPYSFIFLAISISHPSLAGEGSKPAAANLRRRRCAAVSA